MKYLKHQWRAIESNENLIVMAGGIGSSKTTTCAMWAINHAQWPGHGHGAFVSPTEAMSNRAMDEVERICRARGVDFTQKGNIIKIDTTKIHFIHRSRQTEGYNFGFLAIDEASELDDEIFGKVVSRLRAKNYTRQIFIAGTPDFKGSWFSHMWDKAGLQLRVSTQMNPHVSADYVKNLKRIFDIKGWMMKVQGYFV